MSNNYTQSSFLVPLKNKDEIIWVQDMLAAMAECARGNDVCIESWAPALFDHIRNCGCVTNSYEIQREGDKQVLWVCHDETFDVVEAAEFVHAFLSHYDLVETVEFEWAETCSQPCVGEFAGGACVVTAKGWDSDSTRTLLKGLRKKLED